MEESSSILSSARAKQSGHLYYSVSSGTLKLERRNLSRQLATAFVTNRRILNECARDIVLCDCEMIQLVSRQTSARLFMILNKCARNAVGHHKY